jgi:predicted nucleotidyltransferase
VLKADRGKFVHGCGLLGRAEVTALNPDERRCLDAYVDILRAHFGARLERIELFGSAARGDMWAEHQPFRSDIDLLVFTDTPVLDPESDALVDATYPLFLDCGRQISPHFVTEARATAPETDKDRDFFARIEGDREVIWPVGFG